MAGEVLALDRDQGHNCKEAVEGDVVDIHWVPFPVLLDPARILLARIEEQMDFGAPEELSTKDVLESP